MGVNTKWTGLDEAASVTKEKDVLMHMLYAKQQRLDGYEEAVVHAQKHKSLFDKKVLESREGKMDNTHSTKVKLAVRWSPPVWVAKQLENTYELVWRNGTRVDSGPFHVCHVNGFRASPGTKLWDEQAEVERSRDSKEKGRCEAESEDNKLAKVGSVDIADNIEDVIPCFKNHEGHWGADTLLREQLKSVKDTRNKAEAHAKSKGKGSRIVVVVTLSN
ncbi:hypothetical protein BDP27DRAFT_1374299 [Rhodocollybia butyracea]|uniref:Uncharacterized protein n=1 Tax=Rhodocollybia butyracea TaxID=206335 RepID=A0A9P5TVJ3_9AGAR|nr:hypothetical protein BDP27DRAFT_1374299 [Rhodocollybia butyracea]